MKSNPRLRRWQTLAATTPVAFFAVLAAIWLLYDAPFVRAGAWAAGVSLLAVALLVPPLAMLVRDITGRRQAERALRLNEDRLRQVIRVSHIGIFDHDHVRDEIYWSPEQREIYGWGPDEPVTFTGTTGRDRPQTWSLIHPEDRERVAAALTRAHTTEEGPFDIEYRIIRRDGTQRWVSTRSQTFFEGEGAARRAVRTIGAVQDITERKRAERQLELTQTSIERSNFAVFWMSPAGQVTYGNEHACQSLGLTREELIGKRVWDFDPDFSPETWERAWRRLEEIKFLRSETHHRRKDGTIFPVETTGAYVEFEGEEHAFVSAQDVTERQRAEEALAMFRHSIDRASDPIYWLNRDGGFDYVNDEACRALGYSHEELIRLRLWDVDTNYPEAQWRSQWEEWEGAGHDSVAHTEGFHRRKDGTVFPIEVIGQHIWAPGGRSLHVSYIRNVTESKRAERALRESEERLRQVALVYDIGVFDHDLTTGTVYWSPELRRYLGLSPDEPVVLSRFIQSIHPQDIERVQAAVQRALDPAGDGRYDLQHRIVLPNGSIMWLESRSQTYFAGEGAERHPVRTVGAMVEITARVAAEEALRESLREKETLLREVHHRVKNNLQIIASLLHFQAKKIKDPDDLAAFFEGRDRLRSMILVHEKLYQSRGLARIDFGNYLQSLAAELARSHGARSGKRIDVRVTADRIALPIESALPCGMIVCELLTNVFKYAFPGERSGSALVQLVANDARVRLTVSDDGVGLPLDFDPKRSTSFGWQLIYNLTAQLGGTVNVESGGGTRVSISFAPRGVDH